MTLEEDLVAEVDGAIKALGTTQISATTASQIDSATVAATFLGRSFIDSRSPPSRGQCSSLFINPTIA